MEIDYVQVYIPVCPHSKDVSKNQYVICLAFDYCMIYDAVISGEVLLYEYFAAKGQQKSC